MCDKCRVTSGGSPLPLPSCGSPALKPSPHGLRGGGGAAASPELVRKSYLTCTSRHWDEIPHLDAGIASRKTSSVPSDF